MTGLLLTCLLQLSPGVVVADGSHPRHATLLDTPRFVLVDYEDEVGLFKMSREELQMEQNRLDRNKPTLAPPIVLLSLAAVFGIGGGVTFALTNEILPLALAGVALLAGTVLLIVGVVMLGVRLVGQARYREQVDIVQRRIDDLDRAPGGIHELAPPPPPPPPPPSANLLFPVPTQVVAVF